MKIPTAKARRRSTFKLQQAKKDSLKKKARIYLETEIAEAINETDGTCVNIQVPGEAYENMKQFIQYCKDILEPLGYRADESHDGGGMYATLCVSWKELKT